jgi:hypothetical protein
MWRVTVAWFWIAITCCYARAARATCTTVGMSARVTVATAPVAGEYVLKLNARSASATSWGEAGNEAVVLEARGGKRGLIGHLILHQGRTLFDYAMHLGALEAGEQVQVQVSQLTATNAKHEATVCSAELAATTDEGVLNAPEFRWPVQKAFDDVPLVVGWSKSHQSYDTVMTNENGGTAEVCGGGATGVQAEIARWGRSLDIETHYHYGGIARFERCTGIGAALLLRMEAAHPILYEGSGHNRLYESRAGYGQACGTNKDEKPDGDLDGWNVRNPGDDLANDANRVIILRPVPVDLDALDFPRFGGRREALADRYAPWIYRLSSHELAREDKLDHDKTLAMERYLYVDVQVANVGGRGGTYCAPTVTGGFKVRATTKAGQVASSAQITAKYASEGHHDWKRVAIPLPKDVGATDIDHLTVVAFDDGGMYLTALGDAFIPSPSGDNGAMLTYFHQGVEPFAYYIDHARTGCAKDNITHAGPGASTYRCVGTEIDIK